MRSHPGAEGETAMLIARLERRLPDCFTQPRLFVSAASVSATAVLVPEPGTLSLALFGLGVWVARSLPRRRPDRSQWS